MTTIKTFFNHIGTIMSSRLGVFIFVLSTVINMSLIAVNIIAFGTLTATIKTIVLSAVAVILGTTPVIIAIVWMLKKNKDGQAPKQNQPKANIATAIAYNIVTVCVGFWLGGITFWASIVAGNRVALADIADIRVAMTGVVVILALASVVYGVISLRTLSNR